MVGVVVVVVYVMTSQKYWSFSVRPDRPKTSKAREGRKRESVKRKNECGKMP